MKILYFERETAGHRIPHLMAIVSHNMAESVLVVPEKINDCNCKQYIYKNKEKKKRTLRGFNRMMREVYEICKVEKPDVVHFTDGNIFYRFFGYGLGMFKNYKTVLTNHNAEEDFMHAISSWMISKLVDRVVVTCEYSKEVFNRYGAKNVINIEYPHFNDYIFTKEEGMDYFHLVPDVPVIACIGGTRYDKGLDIMLNALKKVEKPFQLLIAGKAEHFQEDFIDNHITTYKDRVVKHLSFLSDQEFSLALAASDYVAVPYRKGFNGASGPLGEGVWRYKCIIGPSGNNLGDVIEKYHLGYTFLQGDSESLCKLLNRVLGETFVCDESYNCYKEMMDPKYFGLQYRELYHSLLVK